MNKSLSIKRKLSFISTLVVIFTMITSLFGVNTVSVAAMSTVTATDAIANYTITTNANESQEYENMVYYKIGYQSLANFSGGTHGEKIVITLPKNMDENAIIKYNVNHLKISRTGQEITLTYLDSELTSTVEKFLGEVLIYGKAKSYGSENYKVEVGNQVVANGNLVVVPSKQKNPIEKYTSSGTPMWENGSINYAIDDTASTIKYKVEVNATVQERTNLLLTDVLPAGLSLDSATFTITDADGKDVTKEFKSNLAADAFTVDFSPKISKNYFVSYIAKIKNKKAELFENIAKQIYDNGTNREEDSVRNYTKILKYNIGETVYSTKRSITINKFDEQTNTPLSGAKFTVRRLSDDVVIDTVVTDKDGKSVIVNLTADDYIVEEVEAPLGYELNIQPQHVSLHKDNKVLKFYNKKIAVIEKGKIKVTKQDSVTQSALEGAEFNVTDATGKVVATLVTDKSGEAEAELPVGSYEVKETKAPKGYILNVTAQTTVIVKDATSNLTFLNDQEKGKIKVTKQDSVTKSALEGAEFSVTDTTGKVVASLTTNKSGEAEIELPLGTYNVKETKAPTGYVLNVTTRTAAVVKDTPVNLTFLNDKEKGKIRIEKYDADSLNILPGAEFTVTDLATGKVVVTAITDKDGAVEVELPVGKYEVKETKAPAGYVLDSTPQTLQVVKDQTTIKALVNHKSDIDKGKIKIRKYESVWGYPLLGAEFTVTDLATGKIIATLVTNTFGEASLEVPVGKYEVKETKAPVGYILDSTPLVATVVKDDNIALCFMNKKMPEKGKIKVRKFDTDCGYVLAGAEFTVTDVAGKVVATLITNQFGEAEAELPEGNYQIKETKAPAGYVLDSTPASVMVYEGRCTALTFYNEKSQTGNGKVYVTKYDACTGCPLKGAEFTVTDLATGKVVATLVTDGYGQAEVTLPVGKYEIKETKAPTGYVLDSTPKTVTVTKDGCLEARFYNTQEVTGNGKLYVTKYDACTGCPLMGAEFTVTDSTGKVVATLVTNGFGEASVTLPIGTYSVKETKAPTGYVLDSTPKSVTVTKNGCIEARFFNMQSATGSGKINLKKVDACTGGPLMGAEFTVTDSTGKVVSTLITNGFGEASVTLPIGTYSVKETKAPTGYVLDSTPKSVTVTKNGCIEVRFCNFQAPTGNGKINLKKVDACTGSPLMGAEFTVTDSTGKVVSTLITNGFGEASVTLPIGIYSVKETKAPTGYVLDSTPKSVTVTKNGCVEVRFCNFQAAPTTGKIRIVKYDSTGCNLLSGAEFTVVDVATGKTVAVMTTDRTGEVTKEFPIGKYEVKETKAPVGYIIDNVPAVVTLEKDKTIKLVSYNKKMSDCTQQQINCGQSYYYTGGCNSGYYYSTDCNGYYYQYC